MFQGIWRPGNSQKWINVHSHKAFKTRGSSDGLLALVWHTLRKHGLHLNKITDQRHTSVAFYYLRELTSRMKWWWYSFELLITFLVKMNCPTNMFSNMIVFKECIFNTWCSCTQQGLARSCVYLWWERLVCTSGQPTRIITEEISRKIQEHIWFFTTFISRQRSVQLFIWSVATQKTYLHNWWVVFKCICLLMWNRTREIFQPIVLDISLYRQNTKTASCEYWKLCTFCTAILWTSGLSFHWRPTWKLSHPHLNL
jgi:hypothetical protein